MKTSAAYFDIHSTDLAIRDNFNIRENKLIRCLIIHGDLQCKFAFNKQDICWALCKDESEIIEKYIILNHKTLIFAQNCDGSGDDLKILFTSTPGLRSFWIFETI